VCGVLAQGVLNDAHFSVTCPVDFFSRVRVDLREGRSGVDGPDDCEKTVAAVRRTLVHLRRARVRATVSVNNPIPRGRGLGSSSADLSAAIGATALAIGEELAPEDIAQIALSIEPSAGVMMPGLALFDHRTGFVLETLGPPPPMEIVAIDFGESSRSGIFNLSDKPQRWQAVSESTDEALALIKEGIAEKSADILGRGASLATEACNQIVPRPRLASVFEFAESVGAVGVNSAFGEGVFGVLLDAKQRRGKSTYLKAKQAFPDAETVYHFRMLGGGVQTVAINPG
jgi:L-threonine kinase